MKDPDTQHTRIEKSPKITTASKNSWGGDEVDTALPRQYRNVPQIRSAEAKSMKENQLFGMETVGFQALSLRHNQVANSQQPDLSAEVPFDFKGG